MTEDHGIEHLQLYDMQQVLHRLEPLFLSKQERIRK